MNFLVPGSSDISEIELAIVIANSLQRTFYVNKLVKGKFEWQPTASAFSVSKSDVDKICIYILSQPEHHKKENFEEEYQAFIKHYQSTIKGK